MKREAGRAKSMGDAQHRKTGGKFCLFDGHGGLWLPLRLGQWRSACLVIVKSVRITSGIDPLIAKRHGASASLMSISARVLPFCLLLTAAGAAPLPEKIQFNAHVRPILSDKCFACHGPDKNTREADLRLDLFDAATAPLQNSDGRAIVPGKPADSVLLHRIDTTDPDDVMPPPNAHKTITKNERAVLEKWIAQGAEYEPHWSYTPLHRAAVPAVKHADKVLNPIDAFILARLENAGIAPAPDADAATLIRRLTLDLTGLPPTPAETAAFEKAAAQDLTLAIRDAARRLMQTQAYGERMAVPWLDAVRYADTVGIHGDQGQRIWPYRDYVIQSFRRNKPYDQFVTEQVAGDLLPEPTAEQLIATGFTRLNQMTREGGAQPKEYLAKYAADRVRAVGAAFLGQTTGCAECHDHKFDPISQHDFYAMAAFFSDVKQWGVYQDYGYTPNPDLKGWSNDKPWPPEIVAQIPSELERLHHLQHAMLRTLADGPEMPEEKTARALLLSRLLTEPDGWTPLRPDNPVSSKGTTLQAHADAGVTLSGPVSEGDVITIPVAAEPMRIAALRVEVMPAAEGGTVGRGKDGKFRLAARFEITGADGKSRPLDVRWAQADLATEEGFFNGDVASVSLTKVWRAAPGRWEYPLTLNRRTHTAVFSLKTPVRLGAEERLTVRLETPDASRVRISATPFPDPVPGQPAAPEGLRAALRSAEPSPEDQTLIRGTVRLMTTPHEALPASYHSLLTELRDCRAGWARSMIAVPVPEKERIVTRILPRGNWQDESKPLLEPAVFHFLPTAALPKDRRLNRLDLAKWITAADNPLPARHFVNRLWKQFYGAGLSNVLDDLGGQGEWPSHPELLDWLAVEFRESGWNMGHMVELMVTSRTWRQQAAARTDLAAVDAANRLLGQQNARRLDAEFVRDNALAVAGLLDTRPAGGASAFPWQPENYYEPLNFPQRDYPEQRDSRQYRRGLYMHWQRSYLHPMLASFDAPSREECAADRLQANSPQQALTLLNDPTFVEAARAFAGRILTECPGDDTVRIRHALQLALGRAAAEKEVESLTNYLAAQRTSFRSGTDDPKKFLAIGMAPVTSGIDAAELAAWTQLCRAVLNLHETITRY